MYNKLISIICITSFLNCTIAWSDCPQPVTLLQQGQTTACTGYLFTLSKETQVRQEVADYHLLQSEDTLKDNEITDLNTQLSNLKVALDSSQKESQVWQEKAVDEDQKLVSEDSDRSTKDLLLIGLGVLMTLAAGITVKYASK